MIHVEKYTTMATYNSRVCQGDDVRYWKSECMGGTVHIGSYSRRLKMWQTRFWEEAFLPKVWKEKDSKVMLEWSNIGPTLSLRSTVQVKICARRFEVRQPEQNPSRH